MSQDFRLKLSRRNDESYMKIIENDKIPNSVTYKIEVEDHTLGDLIRIFLLKNEEVKFAGYRMPHPLENILEIKVHTNEKHPNDVMRTTLAQLQKDLIEL
jgi:DNA-directed RNA polymerase II subunit RPB11